MKTMYISIAFLASNSKVKKEIYYSITKNYYKLIVMK